MGATVSSEAQPRGCLLLGGRRGKADPQDYNAACSNSHEGPSRQGAMCRYMQRLACSAAARGDVEVLHALSGGQHGSPATVTAVLNTYNSKGFTPLQLASANGHAEVARLLLEQGADPWMQDKHCHRTPLMTAALLGHETVVRVLLEHLPVEHAVGSDGITKYMNARSLTGFTALHYAVVSGSVPTVHALLEQEPLLTPSNTFDSWEYSLDVPAQSTPLHVAAARGNTPVCLELLRFYAERADSRTAPDPRLPRDSEGRMPWQVAQEFKAQQLAALLHPSVRLTQIFTDLQPVGVCSLKALAAAAHRAHLLASIAMVQGQEEGAAGADPFMRASSPDPAASSQPSAANSTAPQAAAIRSLSGPCYSSRFQNLQLASNSSHPDDEGPPSSGTSLLSASTTVDADADDTCPICYSAPVLVKPSGCGHALCAGCAQQLCSSKQANSSKECVRCPYCRGPVSEFTKCCA